MKTWSVADIPDVRDKKFVVTGANSGLGFETTKALVGAGAAVTMACRSVAKAESAASALAAAPGQITISQLDLADLASVREFAERTDAFDVLVNNAGVMGVPLARTADGFEMQFGTNHLGHFALTGLLLPKIAERVVTVSSGMHFTGRVDLDDPNFERRKYGRWSAYSQSKLANLLFGYELARRLTKVGSQVESVVAHPGYANTGLQSQSQSGWDKLMAVGALVAQSAAGGALPLLRAATGEVRSGAFYGPAGFGGMRGSAGPARSSRRSHDEVSATALWTLSEDLTGVRFLD